jgi:nucleotide-binding universal stress UspA family protein
MAFKKILIAFDNSAPSRVALQKACDMSSKFGSSLTALFVDNKGDGSFMDSKKFLEDFASSKDLELEIVEREGRVYSEVIKLEKDGDFELIIMGTHGHGGWQKFWVGSNAFKVISSSSCPVISVQESSQDSTFDNIVLPLANSDTTRQKVPYCMAIAKAFNATVHILAVSKSDSDKTKQKVHSYVRQAERYLAERNVRYTVQDRMGSAVPETIIEFAQEVNAGLLLIMTETESAGVFMDTYAQQLVNQSPIPVMSVHSRDTKLIGNSGY